MTETCKITHLTLTPDVRRTLEAITRSTRCPYGLHKRARTILLLAEGLPISEVARRVVLQRRHVYRWVARFQAQGVPGLFDLPHRARGGRAPGPALGGRPPAAGHPAPAAGSTNEMHQR